MNIKKIIVFICLTYSANFFAMSTEFTEPSTFFPKAQLATPNLGSFEFQIINGKADDSYNCVGDRAPLLAFHGAEDLLSRFIDPSLPYNDTSKVGQAVFDGRLQIREFGFEFKKNITNGFFLNIEASTSRTLFRNITMHPVNEEGTRLTDEEIKADSALNDYLTTFREKILPHDPNAFVEKDIGQTFTCIGYAKNFQNFDHADFVDFSMQIGLATPEILMEEENGAEKDTFAAPTYSRSNVGFPMQVSGTVGFFDWLNIGSTVIFMPFLRNNQYLRLNPSPTNNLLLVEEKVPTRVHHKPFLYFNFFIEADQLIPRLTTLFGFSYAKQYRTTYDPFDGAKYPSAIVNAHSLHRPWETATFHLQAELDFASEDCKYAPRLAFIYVQPMAGSSIYRTRTLSGQFGLEFGCEF